MLQNPFSAEELAGRRTRFFAAMPDSAVAIIPGGSEQLRNGDAHYSFRANSDFYYLTGFSEPDSIALLFKHAGEQQFVLFVRPRNPEAELWDGKRAGMEGATAQFQADQAFDVADFSPQALALASRVKHLVYNFGYGAFDRQVLRLLEGAKRQGARSHGGLKDVLLLGDLLHRQRLIKSPEEQKVMRRAAEISAEAHTLAMRTAKPGMPEYQLAGVISGYFAQHGCEPAYNSIVGGGNNACILHYIDNNQPMRDGDLVLIDAGAEYAGYAGDITRSFPVNGRFSPEQKALYEIVLAAQQAAIDNSTTAYRFDDVHNAAVEVLAHGLLDLGLLSGTLEQLLESGAYKSFYMHRTGHWLGLDVHDVGSYLSDDGNSLELQPGMAMTVEPGLYIAPDADVNERWQGIGIRIEDDILVTSSEPDVLTRDVVKTIPAIESLMADAK